MNFIPGFGRNYNISDFAFTGELNSVSDLIYTEEGFAVFKIAEIKEAGVRPLSEVESAVRNKIKIEKQKELAREYATQVETWLVETGRLAAVKVRDNKAILKYDSTTAFTLRGSIPGLGYDYKFNAQAFALDFGQISAPVETNRGIYWMKLNERTEFDSVAYQAQKESIRQRLLNRKRSQVFNEWYEYLKEQADIEDNREMFNL